MHQVHGKLPVSRAQDTRRGSYLSWQLHWRFLLVQLPVKLQKRRDMSEHDRLQSRRLQRACASQVLFSEEIGLLGRFSSSGTHCLFKTHLRMRLQAQLPATQLLISMHGEGFEGTCIDMLHE